MRRTAATLSALLTCAPLAAQQTPGPHAPAWGLSGGVCYEVFVRSFYDSDGDGVGDLKGLIQKLDYINDGDPATTSDLGARCIWLMPVNESPSYHGYDITNYYQVNRDYGTNADFKRLVAEAHRRGIKILFDLVLNHTSSQYPRFRSALLYRDSPWRDWYIWSPEPKPHPGWQAEVWHKVPGRDEYYYGLFWSGMPDLNLANAAVKAETRNIARFWLDSMGVDGFRLDAVRHFFEGPHGEWKNVPATHPWLRDYAADLRAMDPNVFTVGEVFDSLADILPYYPDQLDSYFMFQVADAIIGAARSGSKRDLVATLEAVQRSVPAGRWSSFLRNHDQTRTMTELNGDVARAKLAASLLLTLPGLPFVYYGEEIGMTGSKSDGDIRLRTPMQWARRPGVGFTTAMEWEPPPPDSLTANVQAEQGDSTTLLNTYRRLIHLRTDHPILAAGDFVSLETADDGVLAFLRRDSAEAVLVLSNLTDQPRPAPHLASDSTVLRPGRYRVTPLLGGEASDELRVGRDGRIRGWVPVERLAPLETRVLEVRPERR